MLGVEGFVGVEGSGCACSYTKSWWLGAFFYIQLIDFFFIFFIFARRTRGFGGGQGGRGGNVCVICIRCTAFLFLKIK